MSRLIKKVLNGVRWRYRRWLYASLVRRVQLRLQNAAKRKLRQNQLIRSFGTRLAAALGLRVSLARDSPGSIEVPMFADESLARVEAALAKLSPVEHSDSQDVLGQHLPSCPDMSVAVIVPTYGDGKFLGDCLRSVLAQTHKNWVCYIVDDASPDSVDGLIADAVGADDRFVLIRHTRNRGLAAARNTALSIATEDLVQFLDADDMLTPWSLENRVATLINAGEAFAGSHGQILQCTEETRLEDIGRWTQFQRIGDRDFISADGESPFTVHAPLMRTSIAREIGGFDEGFYNGAEDWEFWSRVLRTGARFAGANRIAGAYRQRASSMIRQGLDTHLSRAEDLMDRADLRATWSSGENAPISLGLNEIRRQSRLLKRTAVWSGISMAATTLQGEYKLPEQQSSDELGNNSPLEEFLYEEIYNAARRGVIRGFGLSVNCVMRLSDHANSLITEIAKDVTAQVLKKIPHMSPDRDSTEKPLVIDQSISSDSVIIALANPRDYELVGLAGLDVEGCVFLDLSSEGGFLHGRSADRSVVSLAEFLLQWRSSTPARLVASKPLHPVLRSPEVATRVAVEEFTVYNEDLYPDVEPEVIEVPYRKLFKKEEDSAASHSYEELQNLKDVHQGETCIVIGNGPSLNLIDMDLVSQFPHFAVNSYFLLEDKIKRPPDFYVVEDTAVFKDNFFEIIDFEAKQKFFPMIYKEKLLDGRTSEELGNPLFFRMNQGFYGRSTGTLGYPRFSQDFSQRAYCGQSVTMINLQLAYWMGFERVLLVGMDFSYQIPSDAKVNGNIIVSQSDDHNHFDPRYFGAGKTWKDPKLSRVLQNYRLAKEVFETDGRQILNCTVGGALEIFERTSLEKII